MTYTKVFNTINEAKASSIKAPATALVFESKGSENCKILYSYDIDGVEDDDVLTFDGTTLENLKLKK